MHDDRRHQLADGRKLRWNAALQFINQFHEDALVAVECLGVRSHCALFGAFEPGHDLGLFRFKLLHPGDELFWRQARDNDGVNDPLHLAPDLAEPPF